MNVPKFHFRVAEPLRRFCFVLALVASNIATVPDNRAAAEPAHFKNESRKTVCIITGENEYNTAETLPAFAKKELEGRGIAITYTAAPSTVGSPLFANYKAIEQADLLLISVRRRTPPKAMMDLIRAHVAAGKAIVGIRTASHAFDAKPDDSEQDAWPHFDTEILGGEYLGHYANKPPAAPASIITIVSTNAAHPVLIGLKPLEFPVTSHLYKYRNLAPTVAVLLQGHVKELSETQPVAWVNTAQDRRVFYTSLGSPEDFEVPAFRRLLLNGILWALREPIPPFESKLENSPAMVKPVSAKP